MKVSRTILVVSTSIVFAVALAACDKPGPAESAGKSIDQSMEKAGDKIDATSDKLGKESDKAGEALEDAAITTKIKAAILAEPGLRVLQINVDTVNGASTLSGTVDSKSDSDRAKEIAGSISGVKRVDNQLVLKSPK